MFEAVQPGILTSKSNMLRGLSQDTNFCRQPSIVDVQILRVGQLVILAVPGELTTMSGRRLREAIYDQVRWALFGRMPWLCPCCSASDCMCDLSCARELREICRSKFNFKIVKQALQDSIFCHGNCSYAHDDACCICFPEGIACCFLLAHLILQPCMPVMQDIFEMSRIMCCF